MITTFDSLAYFEKLKAAGVPEPQAKVQAEGMLAQSDAIHAAIQNYDEARRKELATKGDIQDTRQALTIDIQDTRQALTIDIQDTRQAMTKDIQDTRQAMTKDIQDTRQAMTKDIQDTRLAMTKDIQDTRLKLEKEIQEVRLEVEKVRAEVKVTESRLLKWQIGIALALAAIMARGFNWLGF